MIPNVDTIRRCYFTPYAKGKGPTFRLQVWDLHRPSSPGAPQSGLGYQLTMRECAGAKPVILFMGDDYGCSPMTAIDSDASIEGLMGFLTLQPGDTDSEYFEAYTPTQLEFAGQHGEALGFEVTCRFGEEG